MPSSYFVSIHTLHELEASLCHKKWVGDVRFWVSIHTLHELEARPADIKVKKVDKGKFPFIRFTNWKQALLVLISLADPDLVSIHTLHELEASWLEQANRFLDESFTFQSFTKLKQVTL